MATAARHMFFLFSGLRMSATGLHFLFVFNACYLKKLSTSVNLAQQLNFYHFLGTDESCPSTFLVLRLWFSSLCRLQMFEQLNNSIRKLNLPDHYITQKYFDFGTMGILVGY